VSLDTATHDQGDSPTLLRAGSGDTQTLSISGGRNNFTVSLISATAGGSIGAATTRSPTYTSGSGGSTCQTADSIEVQTTDLSQNVTATLPINYSNAVSNIAYNDTLSSDPLNGANPSKAEMENYGSDNSEDVVKTFVIENTGCLRTENLSVTVTDNGANSSGSNADGLGFDWDVTTFCDGSQLKAQMGFGGDMAQTRCSFTVTLNDNTDDAGSTTENFSLQVTINAGRGVTETFNISGSRLAP